MKILNAYESQQFLKKEIPFPKTQITHHVGEVTLTPPFVLKIISLDAIHKTDIHGVVVVHSKDELAHAYTHLIEIIKKKRLRNADILAQEFVKGTELIIGIKKDPVFGHLLLLGVGGIFAEIVKDVSVRKCPITLNDAEEMILDLQAHQLFDGARGLAFDRGAFKRKLVSISHIPKKYPRIAELDLNPYIVSGKQQYAVDARLALS